ncbi:MAG: hypothetical protein ACRCXZ_04555 [Patescibacteria group bacterium]
MPKKILLGQTSIFSLLFFLISLSSVIETKAQTPLPPSTSPSPELVKPEKEKTKPDKKVDKKIQPLDSNSASKNKTQPPNKIQEDTPTPSNSESESLGAEQQKSQEEMIPKSQVESILQQKDQQIQAREQQVQVQLQEIEQKLKEIEARSIGPKATPLQIQANQVLIADLQSKTQELLQIFQNNNQFMKNIENSKELTLNQVVEYGTVPAKQKQIVTQLLELEAQLRVFDQTILFPVLEIKGVSEISKNPTFVKLSESTVNSIFLEFENILKSYLNLPSNQYRLQNPTQQEQKDFFALRGEEMYNSKLPIAKRTFHEQLSNQLKINQENLLLLKQKITQLSIMFPELNSLDQRIKELEAVQVFGKTSPEEIANSSGYNYTGNNQIDVDKSQEIFVLNLLRFLSLGASVIMLIIVVNMIKSKQKKSDTFNDKLD